MHISLQWRKETTYAPLQGTSLQFHTRRPTCTSWRLRQHAELPSIDRTTHRLDSRCDDFRHRCLSTPLRLSNMPTRSSAVAERPRDASGLSVVSFSSIIPFIIKGLDTCYSATYMSQTRDQAASLYNLGSGSWLACANGAAAHCVAIHCLR